MDPGSIDPEESLKWRNSERRLTPGSYPNLDSGGRKVLRGGSHCGSYEELRGHYDDDWSEVDPWEPRA